MMLRRVGVLGHGTVDVLLEDGRVAAIGSRLSRTDEDVDCHGGALLPGLHDHHIHLLATAALGRSVSLAGAAGLLLLEGAAPGPDGWIRGVDFDGEVDAAQLDGFGGPHPTRVQHRSGALWMVNSAGVVLLGLDTADVPGIERDAARRATGRLWRLDGWLRDRIGAAAPPDLSDVSARLAGHGIIGVTDATPELTAETAALLTSDVLQHLTLLGVDSAGEGDTLGPRKVVLGDHELPSWEQLSDLIRSVRPRRVAIHSVTPVSLVFALAVLTEVGVLPGDRIEHAAVAPPEAIRHMAGLGVTVVTQPSLVQLRGADYLDRTEPVDLPCLWPHRSLLDAGVPVGLSSDAPHGSLNPWESIAAAVDRRTSDGRVVGRSERVSAWQALRGFLTPADKPGGPERVVAVGQPADLVLLDRTLDEALAAPADVRPRLTLIDGCVAHSSERSVAGP